MKFKGTILINCQCEVTFGRVIDLVSLDSNSGIDGWSPVMCCQAVVIYTGTRICAKNGYLAHLDSNPIIDGRFPYFFRLWNITKR